MVSVNHTTFLQSTAINSNVFEFKTAIAIPKPRAINTKNVNNALEDHLTAIPMAAVRLYAHHSKQPNDYTQKNAANP